MKKTLLILSLIATIAITFFACSEREHTNPLDSEYWNKSIDPVATLTKTVVDLEHIRLNWSIGQNTYPGGYKFRIDRKSGSNEWVQEYQLIPNSELNYTDTNTIGITYQYKVFVSFDENISTSKDLTHDNAIPAPTALNATQTSITSANLSWTDNSIGEEKFEIERKLSTESTYTKVAEVTGSDTATKSWADATTIPNLTYDYKVTAVKGTNKSASITKQLANPFQAPTGLTATQNNVYTFTLNWTDNSTGEDGFKIERKIDDGSYSVIATVTGTSYVDNTVSKGFGTVYYQVRAYKGTTYFSSYAQASSAVTFPDPTNLTVTQTSITSANLTWTDNSLGEERFEIERKLSTESTYIKVAEITGSDTATKTWSDTALIPNLTYDYRVRAIKGINSTAYISKQLVNLFQAPTGLTVIQNNVYTFTLNWTDNSTGEDGFKIERKIDDGSYSVMATVTGTSYVDNSVSKGFGTVYYQVRAYKGTTYFSSYATANSAVLFPAPTNLTVTQTSITSANINWTDNSIGEEKFEIERKLSSESTYTKIAEVSGSDTATKSWSDSTLTVDLIYDYQVRAVYGTNSSNYAQETLVNTIPAPSNLTATIATETSIKLDWTDNSTGEDGFKIDRKIGAAGTWVTDFATVGANVKTYTNTGLTTGTTYYYRVRAYYSTYYSNYSSEVSEWSRLEFIEIPTGSFSMGSTTYSDEQPIHTVNITRPFYLGKYEVTQKEWSDIMGSNPASGYGVGDNYPVYYVSWYSILVYCNKRSMAEGLAPCYTISGSTDPAAWGSVPTSSNATWNAVTCNFSSKGYRLPTEAEWEYAARYNDGRTYPWGETAPSSTLCNYNSNVGATTAVGSYPSGNSNLGLCDMAGNVWEWVWDWYATYPSATETDPDGPDTAQNYRVLRGGSGSITYDVIRCASRYYYYPYGGGSDVGFRLSRTK